MNTLSFSGKTEWVLLDLGTGRLQLINDKLHDAASIVKDSRATTDQQLKQGHLTPMQKKICIDFLLRMKLRRKLSNQLMRRLNRVAHAMVGEDVSPPPPPKYGDPRFQVDQISIASQYKE